MRMDAPQKIVGELGGGWLLEADDARALRIKRGENVLDCAVLSAGVERLQDDQDRVLVLGVEQDLLMEELLQKDLDFRLCVVMRRSVAGVGGVTLAKVGFLPRLDDEFFPVIHRPGPLG